MTLIQPFWYIHLKAVIVHVNLRIYIQVIFFFILYFFEFWGLHLPNWQKTTSSQSSLRISGVFFGCFGFFIVLFIYFYLWLPWVFVSAWGLSLVAASGGHSSSRCAGLSLSRPLLLRSTGSRLAGSVIVAHGPSCSAARGILPDQSSNPCPLH